MGCHENHELSYNQRAFIFEENIFLYLSGPTEQIYTHNDLFVLFVMLLYVPSQQLWSLRDGQFT